MDLSVITPPSTELVDDALQLLSDSHPVVTAHAERSYRFAAMLAAIDGVELDREALYLGCVLHDVGLAPSLDGPERFEVRGANAARSHLLAAGAPPDLAETVWDAIALHATTPIARHKSPITDYANRGIAVDIRGPGDVELPVELVRAVLEQFPRRDFPTEFGAVIVDEVRRHPDTARWCWLESIAVEHVEGYRPADFLAGLAATHAFC